MASLSRNRKASTSAEAAQRMARLSRSPALRCFSLLLRTCFSRSVQPSFCPGAYRRHGLHWVGIAPLHRERLSSGCQVLHHKRLSGATAPQAVMSPPSRTQTGLQRYLSLQGGSPALPWLQNMFRCISTLRAPVLSPFLGRDKVQPVPSPLTMVPTPTDQSKTGPPGQVDRTRPVQAVLKKIKESPKKVNLVAALVRGMRVEDALLQLAVLQKRAAHTVKRVVANARANATHNHGLNGDRLYVVEAFVGKGRYLKRISYHGKGRSGIMHHPSCRLTVIVKEMSDQQEAEIARYQTLTFRERAKHKTPLIPHKLIETSPHWHRKPKPSSDILDA